MGKVIAIDGPSGAGKSTVAMMLAERLGFQYLDTGALYRAVGLAIRGKGLGEDASDAEVSGALSGLVVSFREGSVYLNGEDVSDDIRTTEAGHYSSVFSARAPVREFLLPIQREAAAAGDGLVAEGRDMTTVVFPDACKKFFIDASTEVRAKRRFRQLKEKGMAVSMQEALNDVAERDRRDSARDIAPLRVDEGAVYIDTSDLSIADVIGKMTTETEKAS